MTLKTKALVLTGLLLAGVLFLFCVWKYRIDIGQTTGTILIISTLWLWQYQRKKFKGQSVINFHST
jgi:hypothetical protein